MTDDRDLTVEAARQAAVAEDLPAWVHRFLCSPGSDNPVLADALMEPPRAWLGPVEIPLDQLHRLAGPEGHPVLRPVEEDDWRDDVAELAEKVDDGEVEPPPVIASHRDGQLVLEDGNHRVEAMRRAGREQAWTIVAFESEDERARFMDASAALEG
jgi:hypothetical protein